VPYKGPAGLAGEPEHPEAFVRFSIDQVGSSDKTEVYLAPDIWANMQTDRLEVLLPGHGRFWLRFERPADDGRGQEDWGEVL
jgi:hypothetical protein